MVKQCSPSVSSGVVDSSFKRHGGRSRDQAQIDQKTGLWEGGLSFAPQAGPPCLVAGQTTRACASSSPSTPGATLSQRQVLVDMKLRYGLAPERECGLSFSLSSVYNAFSAIFYQDHYRNTRKQANGMPQIGARVIRGSCPLLGMDELIDEIDEL